MTEEEINETIAEFMGTEIVCTRISWLVDYGGDKVYCKGHQFYTESLDALVPVVEKIGMNYQYSFTFRRCISEPKGEKVWLIYFEAHDWQQFSNKSPSLALATACAKVIKEIRQD